MNLVTLIGRLTADPELKFFSSGTAISKGTIAIDRSYKKDNQTVTDFIPVEVWGKQAEYFSTCFQKGYLIAVSGSLHIDRYVDSDGNNRNFAKIVVHKLMRLNVPREMGLILAMVMEMIQAIILMEMPVILLLMLLVEVLMLLVEVLMLLVQILMVLLLAIALILLTLTMVILLYLTIHKQT